MDRKQYLLDIDNQVIIDIYNVFWHIYRVFNIGDRVYVYIS